MEIRIRKPLQKGYGTYFDFHKGGQAPILIPKMVFGGESLEELLQAISKSLTDCINADKLFDKPLVFIESFGLGCVGNFYSIGVGIVVYRD